ncbi:hypothetical protein Verru16b_01371 [Lacunisphaera limnophila]|uniref:Uncharacterized protein n=1 Tax=Lacunisphaera limnophila TaxID=1838286 RepID=A0A1D8ATV9_9BACT|nr:hypothetical protein [Lacunisphaera limnophila]AOS44310.1 hypothetical protein Verru16b_01371 [Lacunisphaera limnophila]
MPYLAEQGLAEFLLRLPKTETHLPIEGACPFGLLQKMDPQRFAAPPPFWDNACITMAAVFVAMPWIAKPPEEPMELIA